MNDVAPGHSGRAVRAYDALLLVSFGGPESPDDVLPFLENVTRGRGVPRERLLEVAEHYQHLGGRSPINDQCRALIAALEPALAAAAIDLPIRWGNRNWHPFLADTFAALRAEGARRILAVTTSAFSSYSSCRQYLENLETASEATGIEVDKVRQYWNHPGFLEAVRARTNAALADVPVERRATTRLVFTAHSIPVSMAERCDYAAELAFAARHLAESLHLPHLLVYQSRSGPPQVPWLGPDVGDAIRTIEGVTDVVVVPLGFTSDHVEVIWDLDHDARAIAIERGIGFHRAATVGTHPAFVDCLVDLVRERLDERVERPVILGATPRADRCAPGCCANAPGRPPTAR